MNRVPTEASAGRATVWRRVVAWSVIVALLAVPSLAVVVYNARAQGTREAVIAVFPHPDDEFQAWSLLEDRPDQYKVFVFGTRGESSGYCEEKTAGVRRPDLGEVPPTPAPSGRWTPSCEEARANSLLGFLTQMSQSDPTIPGNFGMRATIIAPEQTGLELCRVDGEDAVNECGEDAREVWLWMDQEERGAVLMFNLGDGDLEVPEVQWAINSLLTHWVDWGLPIDVQPSALIAGFSNYSSDACYTYPHPDHYAIEQTLYSIDFGVGPQVGATCFRDPRRSFTAIVSMDATDAAFALGKNGERLGAHGRHYGWLHQDTYPVARWRQSALFHRVQSFWVAPAR